MKIISQVPLLEPSGLKWQSAPRYDEKLLRTESPEKLGMDTVSSQVWVTMGKCPHLPEPLFPRPIKWE